MWALIPDHAHLLPRTGGTPITGVMRGLLTGYAVQFNRRHCRHGPLFQNRYKSILCQEDPNLLEPVRDIHLNPLRAKLAADSESLQGFRCAGHCVLLGGCRNDWQGTEYLSSFFGEKVSEALRSYSAFVQQGVSAGRRPELVRGGLVRSLRGWTTAKASRGKEDPGKGDERVLGDGDFVQDVLQGCRQQLERRYRLTVKGCDINRLVGHGRSCLTSTPVWLPAADAIRTRSSPRVCCTVGECVNLGPAQSSFPGGSAFHNPQPANR